MKKCGIIGGISPEATVDYYKGIINGYREIITDGSYPEIIVHSIDMTKMISFIQEGDRPGLVDYISSAVNSLKDGGADFALMSSNTPHIAFNEIEKESPIPMISIVRETGAEASRRGLKRCGLLGTTFTMKSGFYDSVFEEMDISVAVPDPGSQETVHEIIFGELVFGKVTDNSRKKLMDIISGMISAERIDSVILGCTELPLILKKKESDSTGIPFLNTTAIHIKSVIDCITG
ncbi:MAG TPA: amino acid racemase [Spirochaetota bacterium]|nr:amino acid racemase [Spirochaetota bacterium]HPJ33446.1 amino acid racemase [Spirochaetota bacterium]